jgi:hypothetical protein
MQLPIARSSWTEFQAKLCFATSASLGQQLRDSSTNPLEASRTASHTDDTKTENDVSDWEVHEKAHFRQHPNFLRSAELGSMLGNLL